MQLSLEPSERIQFFCVAAFRYMSEQPELAISMIDEGAIATISELCSTKTDEFTGTSLAIALVNLTRINGHCFKCHLCVFYCSGYVIGREGQVVGEAAIVLALMNLIMLRAELGVICVRGLYNLTCVDISYQFIERVIRALVSLSLSVILVVRFFFCEISLIQKIYTGCCECQAFMCSSVMQLI